MAITITFFFRNHRRLGGVFPIHSYIFNFGSAPTPAYVQPEKLFTFLSSFSLLFSFSAFSAFEYIQLYIQPEKHFSCQNVHLFKLFQPSNFTAFPPFQLFEIFILLPAQLLHTFIKLVLCGESTVAQIWKF